MLVYTDDGSLFWAVVIIGGLLAAVASCGVSAFIAWVKDRDVTAYATTGLFLGPIGILCALAAHSATPDDTADDETEYAQES